MSYANIPEGAFKLKEGRINNVDYNRLERENKPMCHIYKTYGKYKYLEIDFISSNWRLSIEGANQLQQMMNMELTFMWLRGYNLKLNHTTVHRTLVYIRGDNLAINYLLNKLNTFTAYPEYWEQYRDGRQMFFDMNNQAYTNSIHHIKGNTQKIR